MRNFIPMELKERCAELYCQGVTSRKIYEDVFIKEWSGTSLSTFRRKIQDWADAYKRGQRIDTSTLESGTYEGFTAHGATVQVDGQGNIVQAWVKQHSNDANWDEIIEKFKDIIIPYRVQNDTDPNEMSPIGYKKHMLEIPLFDMHFGVATMSDYEGILSEIISVISSKHWDEINVLFGQDVLHTNDMRGHTAKGTDIGVIDFPAAWNDCYEFFTTMLISALDNSTNVNMHYTKGNHDECTAWCMFKCLEAKFPEINFDDKIAPRKCISWEGCFIGYGHCEYKNTKHSLFKDFVVEFANEFATSSVREIHCGHLHSESTDDGFMVRRLASAVPTDKWSNDNGYIGSHKRFQLFEWMPNKLKSIIYIGG